MTRGHERDQHHPRRLPPATQGRPEVPRAVAISKEPVEETSNGGKPWKPGQWEGEC